MASNSFKCCPRVNPMDSVPEALSNIIKYDKKQDVEIAKKVNEDALSVVAKSGRYGDLIDKPVALPNPKPITINGQRYDGSEAVTVTLSGEGGGTPVEIDDTLTQSGKAADAKAVGDRLTALNEANAAQNTEIAKKANDADLAAVAKSGSYTDLTNKPTIPTVPTMLPNPNKLTFTGAVTAEYDGSAEVSVEIPSGGGSGSYTLPIASPSTLGGVMPVAKTDDMTKAVGVDDAGGLWAVPGGGANNGWKKKTFVLEEDVTIFELALDNATCANVYAFLHVNDANNTLTSNSMNVVFSVNRKYAAYPQVLPRSVGFYNVFRVEKTGMSALVEFTSAWDNGTEWSKSKQFQVGGHDKVASDTSEVISSIGFNTLKSDRFFKSGTHIEVWYK